MSDQAVGVTEGTPLLGGSHASRAGNAGAQSFAAAAARGQRGPRPAQALPGYPAAASSGYQRSDQEAADEEYARRLAAEEQEEYARGRRRSSDPEFAFGGFRGGGVGLAGLPRGGGAAGGGGGQAPRAQVREAMMGELLTQRRFTQLSFWMLVMFNTPQVIVIIMYSAQYWNKWNSCDRPLNLWLILYGVRLVSSTVVASLPIISRRRWHPRGEAYQRLHDTFNLMGFVVFILGNFWIFDSRTCQSENPVIYHLCFVLICIQYTIMMLPCMLLMCLAPMVFCCLPLLIRLSLFLPAGVGLRVLDQQGASDSLISKLPPAKRYERGMFGGDEGEPRPAATKPPSAESSPAINHDAPECAICLSNYTVGEMVRQLPCEGAHHFHDKCISDWLKIHATCPCCRESLLPLMVDAALLRSRLEAQAARHTERQAAAAAARDAPQQRAAAVPPATDVDTAATAGERKQAEWAPASEAHAEHKQDDIAIDIH